MKIKLKNVLILFNDNSVIKGIDSDKSTFEIVEDAVVEYAKHGVELSNLEDFEAAIDRLYEPLRSRIIDLEAVNNQLYSANEELSEIIGLQSEELDEVYGDLGAMREFVDQINVDAAITAGATLDAELEAAQQELFGEWLLETNLTQDDLDAMLGEVPL